MAEHTIIDKHLPHLGQELRATAERLVEVILAELPNAQPERKWAQLTCEGDWHHWICAVSPTKDTVKLVIHKGVLLADPHGVMEGKGRYVRAIVF